jgi:hypothetical protein
MSDFNLSNPWVIGAGVGIGALLLLSRSSSAPAGSQNMGVALQSQSIATQASVANAAASYEYQAAMGKEATSQLSTLAALKASFFSDSTGAMTRQSELAAASTNNTQQNLFRFINNQTAIQGNTTVALDANNKQLASNFLSTNLSMQVAKMQTMLGMHQLDVSKDIEQIHADTSINLGQIDAQVQNHSISAQENVALSQIAAWKDISSTGQWLSFANSIGSQMTGLAGGLMGGASGGGALSAAGGLGGSGGGMGAATAGASAGGAGGGSGGSGGMDIAGIVKTVAPILLALLA